MANFLMVHVANKKYTVIQETNGNAHALRYGDSWRTCLGDNLILCLAQELSETREALRQMRDVIDKLQVMQNATDLARLLRTADDLLKDTK